ncbi:MAG: hypothetical protein JSS79_20960 [Bacteroidetes bacterium]|nr:hypothetical protein [Bacteroidota bacterium]
MKEFLKRNATGKNALLFFFIATAVYMLMLGITIPEVMGYAQGMKLPDMMPTGYSPEYMVTLLGTLGEPGRNAYLFHQLPLDMIYPFLFGVSYSLIMAYFLLRLGKADGYSFYLSYLPIFAGLCDYIENIGIISMLQTYPGDLRLLAIVTNVFSVLKSMTTTIYFVILILVVLAFAFKRDSVKTKGGRSPKIRRS